ncbi:hypothetical protein CR513_27030, partial [Mucuna pruriens]
KLGTLDALDILIIWTTGLWTLLGSYGCTTDQHLGAKPTLKGPPYVIEKLGVPIRNNGLRKTMKFNHFLVEEIGHYTNIIYLMASCGVASNIGNSGSDSDFDPTNNVCCDFAVANSDSDFGNTQQFGIRGSVASRIIYKLVIVDNQRLENKIIELTSLIRQLAIGQHHISPLVRACRICASVEHPIDAYPILQEIEP